MAKSAPRWVLNPSATPTRAVTQKQVAEALDALQIQGIKPGDVGTVQGAILVALVQHLARGLGYTAETGAPTLGDRPDKSDPLNMRGGR